MNQERIRNFCIIAHIDHGKSTWPIDFRIYGDINAKRTAEQVLDSMDERERGITIKLKAVRMPYRDQEIMNIFLT